MTIATAFASAPCYANRDLVGIGPCLQDHPNTNTAKIAVIDDECFARLEMKLLLEDAGWEVEAFASCERFLEGYRKGTTLCLVLDNHFPGMDGLELLKFVASARNPPPVIMVSGSSGISDAVESMRVGAVDFVEKPVVKERLVASVRKALDRAATSSGVFAQHDASQNFDSVLTSRERQVMELVLSGSPNKNIAADLGISQRTVESHRASIMHKTGAVSLPALTRMMMCRSCPLAA
jgi:two-component system CheB/CheR fusion protein